MGTTDREHALVAAARRFRRAVERYVAAASADDVLHGFPAGTCKNTSVLLARYLDGLGFAPAALVANGHRNEHDEVRGFETHAWLRVEGWHVDITADQFPDAPSAVIVARENPFLGTFRGSGEYPEIATFQWKRTHEARLVAAYAGILGQIGPSDDGWAPGAR